MALIKEVKRETVRNQWRIISILFAELVVMVLIVVQFLDVIGLHIFFEERQVVFRPSADPADFIILAIAVILFTLLYFSVKKRQPGLYEAQKRAPGIIKDAARQKLQKAKSEPQSPALLLIEFLFVAVVVIALRAFFDPQAELIPWSKAGIGQPITTIVNTIIAAAVVVVFYYLYRFTAPYRKR